MKKTPFWWPAKKRKTLSGSLERSRATLLDKFERRRDAAGKINRVAQPSTLTVEQVGDLMRRAERAALKAGVPRPRFPFEPRDVAAIHTQHAFEGSGIWFRLADGRVFRDTGDRCASDIDDYD